MIYKIFRHQFLNSLSSPRIYIGLIIGCVAQILSVIPLYDYSVALNKPLGIFEGFIYLNCDTYTSVVAFLGLLLFISDIPFTSPGETYLLLRTSKHKWVLGKILYLFVGTVMYYLAVLVVGIAYIFANAFIGNIWSEPLYLLTTGIPQSIASTYNVYFPYQHIMQLSPYVAVLSCFGLSVAYGFVMSLLVFVLNLNFSRAISYAGTMVFHIVSYAFAALIPLNTARKYSLLGNSLLMYHDISNYFNNNTLPTITESFIMYIIFVVVISFIILHCIRKYDFKISMGIYNNA